MQIGNIGNYYGSLHIKEDDGKYFWAIEDYDGCFDYEEITKELYDALVKFHNEKNR
jgi:hypothetical protein